MIVVEGRRVGSLIRRHTSINCHEVRRQPGRKVNGLRISMVSAYRVSVETEGEATVLRVADPYIVVCGCDVQKD